MASIQKLANGVDCTNLDHATHAYLMAATQKSQPAIQELTTIAVASLPTGVYSRRGIEKMVRIYFGQEISFVSVRKDLRTTKEVTMALNASVKESLRGIRARLITTLEKLAGNR